MGLFEKNATVRQTFNAKCVLIEGYGEQFAGRWVEGASPLPKAPSTRPLPDGHTALEHNFIVVTDEFSFLETTLQPSHLLAKGQLPVSSVLERNASISANLSERKTMTM